MNKPFQFRLFLLAGIVVFNFGVLGAGVADSNTTNKCASFDFKRQLFDAPSTLSLSLESFNTTTGRIRLDGCDERRPDTPFTFDWGDGTVKQGWFDSCDHTYSDRTRNYVIRVTAHYPGGTTDVAEISARFVPPKIEPVPVPSRIAVTIPGRNITLASSMPGYTIPSNLKHFDDTFFPVISRAVIEYLLSVAAWIQSDLVNGDIVLQSGNFKQVVLRDTRADGMCSLWFTTPVSFAAGDYAFQTPIQYSSFLHEMGHNVTLNSPAHYRYGGKIDGNANAIFSETLAQILAHATAYEIINHRLAYGLSPDFVADIQQSAEASMRLVRQSYDNYLASGKHFHSWNDPATPVDETFNTFMTIAYKFFAYAEQSGSGYRIPAKRMMRSLQTFNADQCRCYSPKHNSEAAEIFRAMLMVAALSHAFSKDLRAEFRSLNFPINDRTYDELSRLTNPRSSSQKDRETRITEPLP